MIGPLRFCCPSRLPRRPAPWFLLLALAALAAVASGCQNDGPAVDGRAEPVTLVVSQTWVQSHQGGAGAAAPGEVQARIASLQKAIDRLRAETHTGWVGRQDDVTGYLGDLTGGSWPGLPSEFMADYGADLFGVDPSVLRFADPDTESIPGATSTRATQAVGPVPVLDAVLVFTGRGSAANTDALRVSGVRGRVYPGLTVGTDPVLTAEQATAAATGFARASGGTVDGEPRLVVLPNLTGVLAWELTVVGGAASGPSVGLYYVDATTGDLLDVRPASADVAPPAPSLSPTAVRLRPAKTSVAAVGEPDPDSVQLTGVDPVGRPITAFGLRTGAGYELVDTTTEAWDSATRRGAVSTYDAAAVSNDAQLPGELVVSPSTTVDDPDALAAQSYSRAVVDFYEQLGRDSWDDQGGDVISSVHYGPADFCNAFFSSSLDPPQMVYGGPCIQKGEPQTASFLDPDVAGHEITHGVTATSANLLYTGQSGALNESFSDYFGNIIGDRIHGEDDDALAEDLCSGMPETSMCRSNPDASRSLRYLLNGATFDDYLRILDPGLRLTIITGSRAQDAGGVHFNSAIWNNALWSIRDRLAQIDGQPGTTSALVASFDRAVYGALTTRLTATSGFFDARAAVEQVIIDSGLDPVVLRVAREVFDQNKICAGCPDTGELAGDVLSSGPQTQLHPKVSGDQVAWLDISGGGDLSGYVATQGIDGGAASLSGASNVVDVAFAGKALIALDGGGGVSRIDGSDVQRLGQGPGDAAIAAGLGGSDQGAAWLAGRQTIGYVDAAGNVSKADVALPSGDRVLAVAAGGGTVAVGTERGAVFTWTPGTAAFRKVGQVADKVYDIASFGGNVFVIDKSRRSTLFTSDGQQAAVTTEARPFGAAMSKDYVIWAEKASELQSGVLPSAGPRPADTDLYLLSLATGRVYDLYAVAGQQGFPSLSGRRLVWQDAAFGGDDVFTAEVPEGL